jgi:hypothetical protein
MASVFITLETELPHYSLAKYLRWFRETKYATEDETDTNFLKPLRNRSLTDKTRNNICRHREQLQYIFSLRIERNHIEKEIHAYGIYCCWWRLSEHIRLI